MSFKSAMKIDLNLDAGEAAHDASEEALFGVVTSVNIACGGHTGDAQSMAKVVELARRYKLRIGAHPSFPDRKNFGRAPLELPHRELVASLTHQISDLQSVCRQHLVKLHHVKPHGALYNLAATDRGLAMAVIEAVKAVDRTLTVIGLAGSLFLDWCEESDLNIASEAFVDRRYEPDGSLRARIFDDALIADPAAAARQAIQIVKEKSVTSIDGSKVDLTAQTLCVHGDSPVAFAIAQRVRKELEAAGVRCECLP